MYIILRGSVSVELTRPEFGNLPIVIANKLDGEHFGELAIFVSEDKLSENDQFSRRTATCFATEDLYCLTMNRIDTKRIILGSISSWIEKERYFFQRVRMFELIEDYNLTPLIVNLKKQKYKLGDYILNEGETPKGLYLICSGQCLVVSESLNFRSLQPVKFARSSLQVQRKEIKNKVEIYNYGNKNVSLVDIIIYIYIYIIYIYIYIIGRWFR